MGHGIFGAGQPAVLGISADEKNITASIASPSSKCVLEFGEGVLESRGSQKIFNRGTYAVYTIPVLKSCQTMATNPVYLVVRKDLEGVLTSVKIMNRSRYNHWVYFSSLK
ncbi:MAG: hypothetical protein H7326_03225 [Bdellovibrionaceae bacterium]|nr:hypothetical protein [Pseudobdellovibrionaceae bacterium]